MKDDLLIDGGEENTEQLSMFVEDNETKETSETPVEATGEDEGTEVTETPAEETYEPNLKFTVKDKELEFDEWVKPILTDKEKEEKLRDLYTKAHGLDELKTTRDTLKTQFEEVRTAKEQQDQALSVVETFIKNKDYRSFFDSLNIPKEDILRYAVEELKFRELPPEQQAAVKQQWDQQAQLSQLQMQNQTLQQQQEQAVRQQAEFELNSVLAKPEISTVASAYDARVGRPGAFRQEVINRGAYHEAISKKVISADEAAQEVMNLIGGSVQAQPDTAPQQQAGQQVVQTKNKPVIPNIQGSAGTSPAKRIPRSISDLRAIRDQMIEG